MKRLTILMLFGGESSEHDVSLNSAKNIYTAIDKEKYHVLLGYIDRNGKWWLRDSWDDSSHKTQLSLIPGCKLISTIPHTENITVDVIFPVLHGKMGEDGTVQGLAAVAHIPIVGCDVEASALCMNKDATKRLAEAAGIPVVPWVTLTRSDDETNIRRKVKSLDVVGPWFVKPARAGSSVGVSKVVTLDAMPAAVENALLHDDLVLIEVAVAGRELEVAVLGNPPAHKASGIGEIIPGSVFYDYDDKYSPDSSSTTRLDARLPKALERVIRQHAKDAYAALGCRGLARIDFLLSDELVPYLNEINTLPGFTDISMYPKLWQHKGMSQPDLVERLIELALE